MVYTGEVTKKKKKRTLAFLYAQDLRLSISRMGKHLAE